MRTHETTIGEGSAYVTCGYQFDSDGDLDDLEVMFQGVNITDALSDQQLAELEDECRAALESDAKDNEYDRGQVAYEERMEIA